MASLFVGELGVYIWNMIKCFQDSTAKQQPLYFGKVAEIGIASYKLTDFNH
jgi:hypothetical protein